MMMMMMMMMTTTTTMMIDDDDDDDEISGFLLGLAISPVTAGGSWITDFHH